MKRLLNIKTHKIVAAIYTFMLITLPVHSFAASKKWPWTKFLEDARDELTGPLPLTLGALGIAIAMYGLLTGDAGSGVKKVLVIILAVSVILFAPTFMTWISEGIK